METITGNTVYANTEWMNAGYYGSDLALVKKLRSGDTTALDGFYTTHRLEFLKWAYKSYNLTSDKALDLYQDTIIILYENVMKGKLIYLQSSLKTYVFAIGKNLILKQFNKDRRFTNEWDAVQEEPEMFDESTHELNLQEEAVSKCLQNLADPYRSILQAYYYQKLSMKAIAEKLGYKNEDVVKSLKVRCLKVLKKAVSEALKDSDTNVVY